MRRLTEWHKENIRKAMVGNKNALKDGLPINQDHPVSDAVKQVRVIVLDQTTNEVGSITFPVK